MRIRIPHRGLIRYDAVQESAERTAVHHWAEGELQMGRAAEKPNPLHPTRVDVNLLIKFVNCRLDGALAESRSSSSCLDVESAAILDKFMHLWYPDWLAQVANSIERANLEIATPESWTRSKYAVAFLINTYAPARRIMRRLVREHLVYRKDWVWLRKELKALSFEGGGKNRQVVGGWANGVERLLEEPLADDASIPWPPSSAIAEIATGKLLANEALPAYLVRNLPITQQGAQRLVDGKSRLSRTKVADLCDCSEEEVGNYVTRHEMWRANKTWPFADEEGILMGNPFNAMTNPRLGRLYGFPESAALHYSILTTILRVWQGGILVQQCACYRCENYFIASAQGHCQAYCDDRCRHAQRRKTKGHIGKS
jgi:hypothetical protein